MMLRPIAATLLLLILSACGPMPRGTGPTPVVQGANGPAAPDSPGGTGMGVGGANGGMGNAGGVSAGGGPSVP